MNLAFEWITTYGYVAIFMLLALGIVGVPVPDEALLMFVGYLSFKGDLQIGPSLFAAFLGAAGGITISYGLGRFIGLQVLTHLGPLRAHSNQVRRAQTWIQRWGPYMLPVAYFIPGVRHIAALLVGASGLSISAFMRFAYAGALLWSSAFIGLGYGFGAEWSRLSSSAQQTIALTILLLATGVAAVLWFLWRRKQQ